MALSISGVHLGSARCALPPVRCPSRLTRPQCNRPTRTVAQHRVPHAQLQDAVTTSDSDNELGPANDDDDEIALQATQKAKVPSLVALSKYHFAVCIGPWALVTAAVIGTLRSWPVAVLDVHGLHGVIHVVQRWRAREMHSIGWSQAPTVGLQPPSVRLVPCFVAPGGTLRSVSCIEAGETSKAEPCP